MEGIDVVGQFAQVSDAIPGDDLPRRLVDHCDVGVHPQQTPAGESTGKQDHQVDDEDQVGEEPVRPESALDKRMPVQRITVRDELLYMYNRIALPHNDEGPGDSSSHQAQEDDEVTMIVFSNAGVQPRAVVVVLAHAPIAFFAMSGSQRLLMNNYY